MKVFKFWPPYQANGRTTFPETANRSGVYLIREGEKLVYIGYSATNLYRTMYRHFQRWNHRTQPVVSYAGSGKRYTVRVILCTPAQAARLEKALIIKHRPRDNRDKYRGYTLDFQDKKLYSNMRANTQLRTALFSILLLLLVLLIAGCSPQKRLNRLLALNPELIKENDSVPGSTIQPAVHMDSTFFALPGDTIIIEQEKIRTEFIRLPNDSFHINTDKTADTVRCWIKVPKVMVTAKTGFFNVPWLWSDNAYKIAFFILLGSMFMYGVKKIFWSRR